MLYLIISLFLLFSGCAETIMPEEADRNYQTSKALKDSKNLDELRKELLKINYELAKSQARAFECSAERDHAKAEQSSLQEKYLHTKNEAELCKFHKNYFANQESIKISEKAHKLEEDNNTMSNLLQDMQNRMQIAEIETQDAREHHEKALRKAHKLTAHKTNSTIKIHELNTQIIALSQERAEHIELINKNQERENQLKQELENKEKMLIELELVLNNKINKKNQELKVQTKIYTKLAQRTQSLELEIISQKHKEQEFLDQQVKLEAALECEKNNNQRICEELENKAKLLIELEQKISAEVLELKHKEKALLNKLETETQNFIEKKEHLLQEIELIKTERDYYALISPQQDALARMYQEELASDEENPALLSSSGIFPGDPDRDDRALITYEKQLDGKIKLGLNPILSESNYKIILKLIDLSYQYAKTLTVSDKLKRELIDKRIEKITDELKVKWEPVIQVAGKTGYNNNSDDITCIISHNIQEKLIVVAFHGSRSGNMLQGLFYNNGEGDWGANYDYSLSAGGEILSSIDPAVQVHRGYANNLASAQEEVLSQIDTILQDFYEGETPWIIVTGHSKGGGMASIAAPILKIHVGNKASVGGLLLSTPRAFYGDESRDWVHKVMGNKRFMLRINHIYDFGPLAPPKSYGYEFRSVGMLARDLGDMQQRLHKKELELPGWLNVKQWLGLFHYGFPRDGGLGFEPEVALEYENLPEAIYAGQEHLGVTDILTPSMIGGR